MLLGTLRKIVFCRNVKLYLVSYDCEEFSVLVCGSWKSHGVVCVELESCTRRAMMLLRMLLGVVAWVGPSRLHSASFFNTSNSQYYDLQQLDISQRERCLMIRSIRQYERRLQFVSSNIENTKRHERYSTEATKDNACATGIQANMSLHENNKVESTLTPLKCTTRNQLFKPPSNASCKP